MSIDALTWKYPLGYDAVEVKSAKNAELSFVPDVPDSLGDPILVIASQKSEPEISRKIAWIFDDATLGTVVLEEDVAFETQTELEEPATLTPGCSITWNQDFTGYEVTCHGSGFSLATMNSGKQALAVDGNGASVLQWIEPLEATDPHILDGAPDNAVLELQLFVQKEGLTADQLAALGNEV